MSQPFKRNYLQHALAVGAWMQANGAQGNIDPVSCALEITCRGRVHRFSPQFILEQAAGQFGFTPQLTQSVSGFVGWLPYLSKVWPIAQDKLAFKHFAAEQGIRTPAWTPDPGQVRGNFIIKARHGSFGRGLRGPFAMGRPQQLQPGEYCEQFIVGQLLKAWFWDDKLAVLELVDMPQVQGDGLRNIRQLISARLSPSDAFPTGLDELAGVQGYTLDTVIPRGSKVLVDYRYMSLLNPAAHRDHDVRERVRGTSLEAQLLQAAHSVWQAVPEEQRAGTAFSLDGVVDAQGQIWFLEANCNPQLHPAFYQLMLNCLFGISPNSP